MKIVGRRNVEFTDNKSGNLIKGITLYFEDRVDNVEGVVADKVFISDSKSCFETCKNIAIGTDLSFIYNRYGKVDDVFVKTK